MDDRERSRILDACVLIDFCQEDSTLLALAARSLGRIVVLSPVLGEAKLLDETKCARLNLSVVEPEMDLVMQASARRGALSFRDRLCLGYAKTHSCILHTNDKPLLNAARGDGVDARWGLEILLELVATGELSREGATSAAQGICDRSRFPSDQLMAEFRRRLG